MKGLIFFLLISYLGFSQSENTLPAGFVYVKEVIPTARVELRYATSENFVGKPIDGYHSGKGILSKEATKALKKVQQELLSYGYSIKIYDAYRPQQAVNHFVRWASDLNDTLMKHNYYPNVEKENLFKEGYIASHSGHTKGSTLDLTLIKTDTGEEVDMGSSYDFFGKESWVYHEHVTKKQRENRLLLKSVMNKHGFKSYLKEWWHFTLMNEPFPDTYFDFIVED